MLLPPVSPHAVHRGASVSTTTLVHFYGWQSTISTGFLLNIKKIIIYEIVLHGLKTYSSLGVQVLLLTL